MDYSVVKQQTDAALSALKNLTYLSENDARQYGRNIQAILGYYAYYDGNNQLVLQGGTQQLKDQKIDLKDQVLFRGVVKSGYNADIGIPILKVGFTGDQAAELTIQDVATIASRFNPDEIACGFPFSLRDNAKPTGPTQYYYIPSATVSSITSRKYDASDQNLSGVFSILSLSGKHYCSNEVIETKYFVTVSLSPVSPLDPETCKLVKPPSGAMASFQGPGAAADPQEPLLRQLGARQNASDLRGKVLDVKIEDGPH